MVEDDFALCGTCWRDTPIITGLCCDTCGAPLPGEDTGRPEHCDDCLTIARPWSRGRAALIYRDNGRKLVLALKHGDRQEVLRPAAIWMHAAAKPLLQSGVDLIAPVPLHWTRLFKRRFNQSALLAHALGGQADLPVIPDLLIRPKRTRNLDGLSRDDRFAELLQSITPNPRYADWITGQRVLIVDDVMTSGATLSAAVQATLQAGAEDVQTLTLARVVKDA